MNAFLRDLAALAREIIPELPAEFWPKSEIPEPIKKSAPTNAVSLKRTGWTNDEVMKIIEGLKITSSSKVGEAYADSFNDGLDAAFIEFFDFNRPATESGAMAYHPETGKIFHIGPKLPR